MISSIGEVVSRRYGGSLSSEEKNGLPLPDLILIDGGRGQVHAAMESLSNLGLAHLSVCGLAKARDDKDERIIVPGRETPLILPAHSPASQVVQLIRDEAHRFALRYHRTLRGKAMVSIRPSRNRSR